MRTDQSLLPNLEEPNALHGAAVDSLLANRMEHRNQTATAAQALCG